MDHITKTLDLLLTFRYNIIFCIIIFKSIFTIKSAISFMSLKACFSLFLMELNLHKKSNYQWMYCLRCIINLSFQHLFISYYFQVNFLSKKLNGFCNWSPDIFIYSSNCDSLFKHILKIPRLIFPVCNLVFNENYILV